MKQAVLIIEDDVIVRHSLEDLLQGSGIEVITASDGREGMKLFRVHQPRVVVTDIIMPKQEGIETIRQIRREAPETKIIAMSGGGRIGNSDLLSIAAAFGANVTLAKPFEPKEFIDAVRKCMNAE
jgi:CheY-like chemotaxis protein